MVEVISQHVDTLKLHYYVSTDTTDDSFHSYLKIVDSLIVLKKESQDAVNNYGDEKKITYSFADHTFRVRPTGISGFSVVLESNDVSIALRKSKTKVNPSPLIKVEFRAEFLARKGYVKAMNIVNDFISGFLLDSYKIKVSEIHLATDIQGYNFTVFDFYRIKTRSRNSKFYEDQTESSIACVYGNSRNFSGFTYGGGDYHLRVYNKTLEINKYKNKAFAKTLLWEHKPNFDSDKTVWRIEIQIRREKLKKLTNFENTTLDSYETVMNSIPDLWARALTDFVLIDVSRENTINIMSGERVLKNGKTKLLSKNAIYGIIKRSPRFLFWHYMKKWNSFHYSQINSAFRIPQASKFYAFNSIKSLLATVGRAYGAIDAHTIMQAFKDAENDSRERTSASLISNTVMKQLDYFQKLDYLKSNGVVYVPSYVDLENNILTVISESSRSLYSEKLIFTQKMEDKFYRHYKRFPHVDNI